MTVTSSPWSVPDDRAGGPAGVAFLSHHAHVVICIARDPAIRLRDMATAIGITERAVIKILADLERTGVLSRDRQGRRNRYTLHAERPLGHPLEGSATLAELVRLTAPSAPGDSDGSAL